MVWCKSKVVPSLRLVLSVLEECGAIVVTDHGDYLTIRYQMDPHDVNICLDTGVLRAEQTAYEKGVQPCQ